MFEPAAGAEAPLLPDRAAEVRLQRLRRFGPRLRPRNRNPDPWVKAVVAHVAHAAAPVEPDAWQGPVRSCPVTGGALIEDYCVDCEQTHGP